MNKFYSAMVRSKTRRGIAVLQKESHDFSRGRMSILSDIIPWLLNHRKSLTVLVHTLTGDDYLDHTDNAVWLGSAEPIDLTVLVRR